MTGTLRTTGICLSLAAFAAVVAPSSAQTTGTMAVEPGRRQMPSGRDSTGDLLTAGRAVRVEEDVTGDVAVAGTDVTVAGQVDGYVMGAGRNVTLAGPIGNDLWAAGETVEVVNAVGNNVRAVGRSVHLGTDSVVGRDARLAGNTVTAEGQVVGDLTIGAASARIGGEVGGTVEAQAGQVEVLPGAVIAGDLVVRGPEPPNVSPQAQVLGQVRYEQPEEEGGLGWPLWWLGLFVALLLLGFAAVAFAPAWAARVAGTLGTRAGASALAGLLLIVVVPLVAGVLLITVVGIPLAVVLLALYVVALISSAIFVAYRLGGWLLNRPDRPEPSPWGRMALGVLIVSAGIALPVAGWLVSLAVMVWGAGALALERRDTWSEHPRAGFA